MKKCSFVKFLRKWSGEKFEYSFLKNSKCGQEFSELICALTEYTKIENVDFHNIDSSTSVIISIQTVHSTDEYLYNLKNFINSLNCKNIFFDLSTYDEQEINEKELDLLENLTDKSCFFISKNLISKRDNHLQYEVLFHHHIDPNRSIPRNNLIYRKLKQEHLNFWPDYKGFYYIGHSRFHKVKFLEFLHQNSYLKDIKWSCTGKDFDNGAFRDFVSMEHDVEFHSFDILNQLPKSVDFELYDRNYYASRGGATNFISYLNSCFEIVAETRFYKTSFKYGSKETFDTWNNISEKTIKPTMLSHPFILIAKPNTISTLEKYGLKYRFDFWDYSYDSIENHNDRMDGIKKFTNKVMSMNINELKEFNNDYYNFSKDNYNIMLNDFYIKSIQNIWDKL
jgi:hypothetical protein